MCRHFFVMGKPSIASTYYYDCIIMPHLPFLNVNVQWQRRLGRSIPVLVQVRDMISSWVMDVSDVLGYKVLPGITLS